MRHRAEDKNVASHDTIRNNGLSSTRAQYQLCDQMKHKSKLPHNWNSHTLASDCAATHNSYYDNADTVFHNWSRQQQNILSSTTERAAVASLGTVLVVRWIAAGLLVQSTHFANRQVWWPLFCGLHQNVCGRSSGGWVRRCSGG
jgi:hypothetical protein